MAEAVISSNMMEQTADGLRRDLDERLKIDASSDSDDDLSSGEHGRRLDAAQGADPALAITNRGLSVIHRRKNLQLSKGPKRKAGGMVDEWLAGQDFGRVFSQANLAHQGFSAKVWKDAAHPRALGQPKKYVRHTQLRVVKGSYRDQFMGLLSWLNKTLPVIHPNAPWKRVWDVIVIVVVLYNAWSVPMEVSFGLPGANAITILRDLVVATFGADILVSFRTAFIDKTGHLVKDTDKIAQQYLKFWFWIDIVATLPYEDIVLAAAGNIGGNEVSALGFLRTPRLLRLGRLIRMLDQLKSANIVRVAVLMGGLVLLSHWLTCVWYMLYKYTSFTDFNGWALMSLPGVDPYNNVDVYISGFFQSFSLLIGQNLSGNNDLERVYMIFIQLAGTIIYSALVGQIIVLLASMDLVGMRHRLRHGTTLDVLSYVGLDKENCSRVEEYFRYITHYSHPAGEGIAFLNELPKPLLEEVAGYAYRKHLQKIPLFLDLEEAFLTSLSLRMRMIMFIPKESIFRVGDLGLEMYIICKGSVAVIGKHNHMVGLLNVGQYFGEIALFTEAKRTAQCISLSYLDLCALSAFDFKAVLKDFPHSAQILKEAATARLRQFQVAGDAVVDEEEREIEMQLMEKRMRERANKAAERSEVERPETIKEMGWRRKSLDAPALGLGSFDGNEGGASGGQGNRMPIGSETMQPGAARLKGSLKRRGSDAVLTEESDGAEAGLRTTGSTGNRPLLGTGGEGLQGLGQKGSARGDSGDKDTADGVREALFRKASVGFADDEGHQTLPLMRKPSVDFTDGEEGGVVPPANVQQPNAMQRRSSVGLGSESGPLALHRRSSLGLTETMEPSEVAQIAVGSDRPDRVLGRKSSEAGSGRSSWRSVQQSLQKRLEIMRAAGALDPSQVGDAPFTPKHRAIRRYSIAGSVRDVGAEGSSGGSEDDDGHGHPHAAPQPQPSTQYQQQQQHQHHQRLPGSRPGHRPSRPSLQTTLNLDHDSPREATSGGALEGHHTDRTPWPARSSLRPADDSAGPTPSIDTPPNHSQGIPIGEARETLDSIPEAFTPPYALSQPARAPLQSASQLLGVSGTSSEQGTKSVRPVASSPQLSGGRFCEIEVDNGSTVGHLVTVNVGHQGQGQQGQDGQPTSGHSSGGEWLGRHPQQSPQLKDGVQGVHRASTRASPRLTSESDIVDSPPHSDSQQQHREPCDSALHQAQSLPHQPHADCHQVHSNQGHGGNPCESESDVELEAGGFVLPPQPPLPPPPAPPTPVTLPEGTDTAPQQQGAVGSGRQSARVPLPPPPLPHASPFSTFQIVPDMQHEGAPHTQRKQGMLHTSNQGAPPTQALPPVQLAAHTQEPLPVQPPPPHTFSQASHPAHQHQVSPLPLTPTSTGQPQSSLILQSPHHYKLSSQGPLARSALSPRTSNPLHKHSPIVANVVTKAVPHAVNAMAKMSPRGSKGSVLSPRGSSPRWRPPADAPSHMGEGGTPQWLRTIATKEGSQTLVASPRGPINAGTGYEKWGVFASRPTVSMHRRTSVEAAAAVQQEQQGEQQEQARQLEGEPFGRQRTPASLPCELGPASSTLAPSRTIRRKSMTQSIGKQLSRRASSILGLDSIFHGDSPPALTIKPSPVAGIDDVGLFGAKDVGVGSPSRGAAHSAHTPKEHIKSTLMVAGMASKLGGKRVSKAEELSEQQQHEQGLLQQAAIAVKRDAALLTRLRVAEQEVDRLRAVEQQVDELQAKLAGMQQQAESDKPLRVKLYKQVKALLATMEVLSSRVAGLDAQMGGMQGQILGLEATSNVTSYGLLGKTLDDGHMLMPSLAQIRPKSGSGHRRAPSREPSNPGLPTATTEGNTPLNNKHSDRFGVEDTGSIMARQEGGTGGAQSAAAGIFRSNGSGSNGARDGLAGVALDGPGAESGGSGRGARQALCRSSSAGVSIVDHMNMEQLGEESPLGGHSQGKGSFLMPRLSDSRAINRSGNHSSSKRPSLPKAPSKSCLKPSSIQPEQPIGAKHEEDIFAARTVKRMSTNEPERAGSLKL